MLLNLPETTAATVVAKTVSLTNAQRMLLLVSYVPFLIIPFTIAVDMSFRLLGYVRAATVEAPSKKRL